MMLPPCCSSLSDSGTYQTCDCITLCVNQVLYEQEEEKYTKYILNLELVLCRGRNNCMFVQNRFGGTGARLCGTSVIMKRKTLLSVACVQ